MTNQNQNPVLSSNKRKIFKCADHADNISRKLKIFYEKNQFFDISLLAGADNVKLQAHRVVLSASSDFFLKMFENPLEEATTNQVDLKEIDDITMKSIIDFMYTAEIELHSENVENVLRTADFLQMNTLIEACCDFMREQIDASNCLGIGLFAEQHNYSELYKEALSFTYAHFDDVCAEKEFVQLSEDQLSKYLSSDELITQSEENVFKSVVAWVKYDKENREKLILNLLSHVRFTLLKPKFIIENRHSVCKTIEGYELICSWLQWHLSPDSRSQFKMLDAKPRKPKRQLIALSGESSRELKLHILNRELNTWSVEELPSSSKPRTNYAAIMVNKMLIIAGGDIDGILTSSVECLDLTKKEWFDLPPMRLARKNAAMSELNGDLFVVGGRITDWSRTVEKYDFSTQRWQDVASLNSEFAWVKAVAVGDKFLYAGGYNSDTMECYNVVADKWTPTANKNNLLKDFGIVALGGQVYAVGGRDVNEMRSGTVECYHHSTDTWNVVNSLEVARNTVKCVALNEKVIIAGGFDGARYLDLVEEYDPKTDMWTSLAPVPTVCLNSMTSFGIFTM